MRPLSTASELPTYAHITPVRLPSYAEQWNESPLARPPQAHVSATDTFDAAPYLEAGQMAPQAPMQPLHRSPAPQRRAQIQAFRGSVDGCLLGCANCCSASAMIGGVVIAGLVMTVVGYQHDAPTVRGIGGGLIAVGIIGAIAFSQHRKYT